VNFLFEFPFVCYSRRVKELNIEGSLNGIKRFEKWGCFDCVMLGIGKGSSSQARGGVKRTFKEVGRIKKKWDVKRSGYMGRFRGGDNLNKKIPGQELWLLTRGKSSANLMVRGIAWAGKVPSPKLGGVSLDIIRVFYGGEMIGGIVWEGVNLLYNSILCCMFIPIS
jgi:hypothetical protein